MADAAARGEDTWVDIPADRCLTRYAFENGHDAHIRHGKIEIDGISVEKSFLCFETKSEAEYVRDNLLNLKGDSFLKPCMIVLHEKRHWLAVDRFDYSLERYCDHNQERWDNSRVLLDRKDAKLGDPNPKEEVTRDIITGIYQLHSQNYWDEDLSITDILIVNHRAKFAVLRGARGGSPDKIGQKRRREYFNKVRKVFKEVLGVAESGQMSMPREELNHFHKKAARKIDNWDLTDPPKQKKKLSKNYQ
ncbi:unnamed protein product [Camellia sinensis]